MELKVDIAFDELVEAIKKLPEEQLSTLKSVISSASVSKKSDKDNFLQLLLKGPVMSNDQYKAYKENRTLFNQWRSK